MAFTYFVIGSGSIGRRHFANLRTMGKSTELLSWRRFGAQGLGPWAQGPRGLGPNKNKDVQNKTSVASPSTPTFVSGILDVQNK